MTNNSKTQIAEFEHFEKVSNPEDFKLINEFISNPTLEENKQRIAEFFANMNVEVNPDELAEAIQEHDYMFNH